MSNWSDLIAYYKTYDQVSQALKIASLAQWIEESGNGTSRLATDYFNFGGIKFRERMVGYAEPIDYQGSDGELTTYCRFSSAQAFVKGYWRFISSGPYGEYLNYKSDASGYIRYIAKQGYAADPKYVPNVLSCFDKAQHLLDIDTSSDMALISARKVAVIVGHNRKSPGAFAGSPINKYEYDFNQPVAQAMKAEAWHYNLTVEVFLREPSGSYSQEISKVYGAAESWGAECTMELHFNSADSSTATGSQALCRRDKPEALALASACRATMVDALGLADRGILRVDPSDRGGGALYALDRIPGILMEPFFGSNKSDCVAAATIGPDGLALAYLRGIRDWFGANIA